jgi:hypothetical protein
MPEELKRKAYARAAELGISFTEYARRLIAKDLGPPAPTEGRKARSKQKRV